MKNKIELIEKGYRIYINGIPEPIEKKYTLNADGLITYLDDADISICKIYKNNYFRKLKYTLNTSKERPFGIKKYTSFIETSAGPLARVLYIWFYGDLKDGEIVAHLDGDLLNNKLSNLKKMSYKELRKLRNPKYAKNQYGR